MKKLVLCGAIAASIAGCASVNTSDIAGYGGIETSVDRFTGSAIQQTGWSVMRAAPNEGGLLGYVPLEASFSWKSIAPDTIFMSIGSRDIQSIYDVSLKLDGELMSFQPIDPRTSFVIGEIRKSVQRYEIPIAVAQRMTTAHEALLRVEYGNNRVSETADLTRLQPGTVTAREMLAGLLARIGK